MYNYKTNILVLPLEQTSLKKPEVHLLNKTRKDLFITIRALCQISLLHEQELIIYKPVDISVS